MARGVPAVEAPVWIVPGQEECWALTIRLLTPLFGGGHTTRQVDELCVVRPATIRGHLRYWWRAVTGASYDSPDAMFRAEEELWGSTQKPGKVALRVTVVSEGAPCSYHEVANKGKPGSKEGPLLRYFLFPFQESKKDNLPEAVGRKDVVFRLEVRLSRQLTAAQKEEIRRSLRAWLTFGGIGARTRRGCGSLGLDEGNQRAEWLLPAQPESRASWLRQLVAIPGARAGRPGCSWLYGAEVLLGPSTADPYEAWLELSRFWSAFRKGYPTRESYKPTGPSRWEDYRRHLLRYQKAPTGELPLAKPHFGLPIIYQRNEKTGARYAPTLEAQRSGRMASPVILKPVMLADKSYAPLVAVLQAPRPEAIRIDGREVKLVVPQDDPVLKDLGTDDPLAAVMEAARRWWKDRGISPPVRLGGTP